MKNKYKITIAVCILSILIMRLLSNIQYTNNDTILNLFDVVCITESKYNDDLKIADLYFVIRNDSLVLLQNTEKSFYANYLEATNQNYKIVGKATIYHIINFYMGEYFMALLQFILLLISIMLILIHLMNKI